MSQRIRLVDFRSPDPTIVQRFNDGWLHREPFWAETRVDVSAVPKFRRLLNVEGPTFFPQGIRAEDGVQLKDREASRVALTKVIPPVIIRKRCITDSQRTQR